MERVYSASVTVRLKADTTRARSVQGQTPRAFVTVCLKADPTNVRHVRSYVASGFSLDFTNGSFKNLVSGAT